MPVSRINPAKKNSSTLQQTAEIFYIPTDCKKHWRILRQCFLNVGKSRSVRLNRFKVKLTVRQDPDLNGHNSQDNENITGKIPHEEDPLISVDSARVVYHRTTITSEVTLHVGRRKSNAMSYLKGKFKDCKNCVQVVTLNRNMFSSVSVTRRIIIYPSLLYCQIKVKEDR
ncbi:uncharacterized protein LOC111624642 [Centruroides sculpturatus]|uniref:uncharacterized protein LOC111624642 n=1 Tax=Centruroides sculpturatus TaxID=218467 RepID=UPI000C6E0773|nr:uncharacterized protein LOC111624642 [Centruroides sculpturatus]